MSSYYIANDTIIVRDEGLLIRFTSNLSQGKIQYNIFQHNEKE